MPRNTDDEYYHAPGTDAVSGEIITASQFNTRTDDIKDDLNAARPVKSGGTGATNASGARSNLDVQRTLANVTTAGVGSNLAAAERAFYLYTDGATTPTASFYRDAGTTGVLLINQTGTGALNLKTEGGAVQANGKTVWDDATSPVLTINAIGSLVFAQNLSGATVGYGVTVAGTALKAAGITSAGAIDVGTSFLTGTWRCLGRSVADSACLFVRVS